MPDSDEPLPLIATAESTDLDGVGYDHALEILDVKFRKSGKTRRYFNVGGLIYQGLMLAQSKGVYFNKFIKKNYTSREIGRA